jgi:hypothetical protein
MIEGMYSGGGQTRGSYHHVSSKGEFDAPPRYHHHNESNPVLRDINKGISPKKGHRHETKIPGITKYQKIELPMVEPLVSGNTP